MTRAILLCVAALVGQVAARGADELLPLPAPPPQTRAQSTWFDAVNVSIDPRGQPLAAYQFELVADGAEATLVGVEGGEHAAFAQPPYYDPQANVDRRIVVAAFDTGPDLPRGKTRVATVMVRVSGTERPAFHAKLQVAAGPDAQAVPADISVSEGVNR